MDEQNKTVLVDIDIPFGRLVMIIIKIALASIPAMIVVWITLGLIMALFGGIFGGFGGMWMHGGRPL